MFWKPKREQPKELLKPLTAQEAFNELIDHLLGEDWYCTDPLGPTQVNAIVVDTIKRIYPKKKRLKLVTKFKPNRG